MQECGLLEGVEYLAAGGIDYIRTEKAAELDPILQGLAKWAQRYITAEVALEDRDADVDSIALVDHDALDTELPGQRCCGK